MTVSLNISGTSGGRPFSMPQEMATLSPGSQSPALDLYIRHTGTSKIENTKIYILPYSAGVYLGSGTAQDDFNTVIGWGDASHPATSGGGLYFNLIQDSAFPDSEWQVFRTGTGDSLANAVSLRVHSINIGSGVDGEIPALGEAHIQMRVDIPSGYSGSTGTLYVDTLFPFTSTS
jgi:hypothetical protein